MSLIFRIKHTRTTYRLLAFQLQLGFRCMVIVFLDFWGLYLFLTYILRILTLCHSIDFNRMVYICSDKILLIDAQALESLLLNDGFLLFFATSFILRWLFRFRTCLTWLLIVILFVIYLIHPVIRNVRLCVQMLVVLLRCQRFGYYFVAFIATRVKTVRVALNVNDVLSILTGRYSIHQRLV